VSDEMLEDAPQMRSYINARLSLFVQNEEDRQLLQGAGGGNFLGLLPRIPAANRYVTSSVGSANNADHIYEALTVARRSYLEPDTIVVNAEDWADLRLLKDSTQNYIGGAPFQPVGPGEMTESLWGKRVIPTYNLQAGTAVVGAFGTAAQVFRRGGLRVEATNSHSDFFQKNLTAVRAEQREALAVYRPSAFAIADIGYAS
jgi:HK97 family phage major capsid protein